MSVRLFIIGSALRGVGSAEARRGLDFIKEEMSAPHYRIYAIEGKWAALTHDDSQERPQGVRGELVEVSAERLSELESTEPDPLEFREVVLKDGSTAICAFGPREWLEQNAVDISAFGSFRDYLNSKK